ncbi:MAG TPA: FliH/SctL family protein [Symbiobacteriaceae bacterium]|nr:FliH/SctL family protein [Symbiobacteriaceae bacterium]
MSLFKPGQMPPGVSIQRPAWIKLEAAALPAEVLPAAAPVAAAAPDVNVLDEARLQAAQILQDAAVEAELALEEARNQGFEEGRRLGLQAAEEELAPQRQQVEELVGSARSQADLIRQAAEAQARARLADAEAQARGIVLAAREEAAQILEAARAEQGRRILEAQDAVVELAVAAAVRLVQGHLALQPGSVVGMVAAGLRRLKDTECTVRVSPQDLPLLEAQRSALERELGAGLLRLQPDAGLSQGSYIVNSTQGTIDARIEAQEQAMRSALGAALGGTDA